MKSRLCSKGLVFGIMFLLIASGFVPSISSSNNKGVFGKTIYVDDDSPCPGDGTAEWPYCKISYAVENASNGDTILVYSGNYVESVIINVSVTLEGLDYDWGNGADSGLPVVDSNGMGDVFNITADGVTLSRFCITGADLDAGVIISSNRSTVERCRVYGNMHGIVIWGSESKTVHDNIIENNVFWDNSWGIDLFFAENCAIRDNSFTQCGIGIYGKILPHFLHTIEGNRIDGVEIFYQKNRKGMHISGIEEKWSSIILVNCSNVIIEGMPLSYSADMGIELAFSKDVTVKTNNVTDNNFGIYLYGSDDVLLYNNYLAGNKDGIYACLSSARVKDNIISGNEYGIKLVKSEGCTVEENEICNNNYTGLYLRDSDGDVIRNNLIVRNGNGIDIYSSCNITVKSNNISGNKGNGIFMNNGRDNIVGEILRNGTNYTDYGNTIKNNGHNGIELVGSDCNHIEGNRVVRNKNYGIYIRDDSNGNEIYHNHFYGNQFNAYDECENIWSAGYPERWKDWCYEKGDPWCGNHWSDHVTTDTKCGPHDCQPSSCQPEPGSDGVIDYPYVIEGGENIDCYPLLPREDVWPPSLTLVRPQKGFLYVRIPLLPPLLEIKREIDWNLDCTLCLGEVIFEATSTDDQGPIQTDKVVVEFRLVNEKTGDRYDPHTDSKPPFEFDLGIIDKSIFGPCKLTVTARDAAGNINSYTTDYPLFIYKIR